MKYFLRDKETAKRIIKKINKLGIKRKKKIMEACGTHTQTIAKFGLKDLLPQIDFTSGPGCPVCVTDAKEIDKAIEISKKENTILTIFGDIFQVPGSHTSLATCGGNVRIVYDIKEAIEIAKKNPYLEVVHFAIGFETTAPYTAYQLIANYELENFYIIPSHLLFFKAFELLISLDLNLDGFICPGHVSTIIGSKPYEKLVGKSKLPMVIAGFEPNDVLLATYMILKQIENKEAKVEIEYKRLVRPEGNKFALEKMWEVFKPCDKNWRGFGLIQNSGLKLRNDFRKFDAERRFKIKVKQSKVFNPTCRCDEILIGKCKPKDCPLFKRICTPQTPQGPCMVSVEGACNVMFRYGH